MQTDPFTAELVETYTREWPRLRRMVARLVGDDRAEEVVQEAVMKLWRSPHRFDATRGTLAAYLSVVCRSAALDRIRADAARHTRERRFAWSASVDPGSGTGDDGLVTGALDTLPERERTPILLAAFHGLSYRDVAVTLGLPEGTVKSRIRTGLRRLRETLSVAA